MKKKVKINLAFLSVGDDGHIASIFNNSKLCSKINPFFISKIDKENFFRISFTLQYLLKIDQVIFVITGKKKYFLIENIKSNNYSNCNVFFKFIKKTKSEVKVFYA